MVLLDDLAEYIGSVNHMLDCFSLTRASGT